MKDVFSNGKKNILRKSQEPKNLPIVRGYNFNEEFNFDKLISSFSTTGFQASHLSKAIEIINKMLREKNITIFLGYTSNMVTSGLRDIFRFLVENKMVDVIVTTAGGIEEDICKCLGNFYLGSFEADGKKLRDEGINRAGNIFIPNNRYIEYERFIQSVFDELYKQQKEREEIATPSKLISKLGEKINDENSIYFWANKNNIPVFCPGITDGSTGDMIHFYLYKNPDFILDVARDIKEINELTINSEKTGLIILGSGIMKHHILNANMMRDGSNYAVYINNSQEFDGSDSGARPDEAVSWGKILPKSNTVKLFGDATILFPLIVSQTFQKKER